MFSLSNKEELHHIKNVLRIKKGENIIVINGNNEEAICSIEAISSKELIANIVDVKTFKKKLPELILACAIPKKSKFETIIEKTTELGIDAIIPLITKRTDVAIKGDKANKKQERFQTVAINASKQSKKSNSTHNSYSYVSGRSLSIC